MFFNQFITFTLKILNKIFKILSLDYELKLLLDFSKKIQIPYDMEEEFIDLYLKCKNYTLTSIERMYSLYKAIEYIVKHKIPGDIVECGVWRGGTMMLAAFMLLKLNDTERNIYLYDTYEGMTKPTKHDIRHYDNFKAITKWTQLKRSNLNWDYAPLNQVKENLYLTNYPKERLFFVKGKVENTLPNTIPNKISILRLDTDWYESTYHELVHLFPKLVKDGVLIIDDYGHWKGAKKATLKYLNENNIRIFLNRIDYTGRIALKL